MNALFSTKTSRTATGLVRLAKPLCLFLLLALPPFVSVAQDDFTTHQDALVSLELSPVLLSNFLLDTQTGVSSSLGVTADGSSALLEAESPSPAVVPLADAAWLFAAGIIGFVLLSNRRSA